MVMMPKLVILISGNGSNLQAIIDAIAAGNLHAQIACVISNKADAYGLQRAHQHNIHTQVVALDLGETRESYDAKLAQAIEHYQPKLIILAGFMRVLTAGFVKQFAKRLINIHPSLLPKYPGLNTHEKVIENGDTEHGCTIHYVTEQVDEGPIIAQSSLQVLPEDTAESLKQRVHALEHALYPAVIQKLL